MRLPFYSETMRVPSWFWCDVYWSSHDVTLSSNKGLSRYAHKKNQRQIVIIFLPYYVLGAQKNRLKRDGSFEYPQHMFWLRNKKIVFLLRSLN